MEQRRFCYYCQTFHPEDQMERFFTRSGYRWRCRKSIEAAQRSAGERDAFGRETTEFNCLQARLVSSRQDVSYAERRFLR